MRAGDRVEELMGVLPPYDRRREPRKPVDLSLMVWGVDTQGERFCKRLTRATSACLGRYCPDSMLISSPATSSEFCTERRKLVIV
jgi:hypothetical protein